MLSNTVWCLLLFVFYSSHLLPTYPLPYIISCCSSDIITFLLSLHFLLAAPSSTLIYACTCCLNTCGGISEFSFRVGVYCKVCGISLLASNNIQSSCMNPLEAQVHCDARVFKIRCMNKIVIMAIKWPFIFYFPCFSLGFLEVYMYIVKFHQQCRTPIDCEMLNFLVTCL